jgi:hypothetical protein
VKLHLGKREVRIADYLDRDVPMLAMMFERRLRGYRSMGYEENDSQTIFVQGSEKAVPFDRHL